MSDTVFLTAKDDTNFEIATAGDQRSAKGGVVILQEIFGLNEHVRDLPRRYAEAGYYAVAPALFDRASAGVSLGYDDAGKTHGIELKNAVDKDAILDIEAAVAEAAKAGPVGIVGFCWGGSLAWRSAVQLGRVAAAVSYYGGELPTRAADHARCPVLAHFGERDAGIPMAGVNEFIAAQTGSDPAVTTHVYDADHGFNCDMRDQFDAAAAKLAHERTLAFFAEHLG